MPHNFRSAVLATCLLFAAPALAQTIPAATAQSAPAEGTVYLSNFDDPRDLFKWSIMNVEDFEGHNFLGRLKNDTLSLTLQQLAGHAFVHIQMELFIIGPWNGVNDNAANADQLLIRLNDGRALLQTSFSTGTSQQSFPDAIGRGTFPPNTGAGVHNFPGLKASSEGPSRNAIYQLDFVVPHASPDLRIEVRGLMAKDTAPKDAKSWGLRAVKVSLLNAAPVKLTAEEVVTMLNDLRGQDPSAVAKALHALTAAGDEVLPLVSAARFAQPIPAHIATLIRQLNDDQYKTREAAQNELESSGLDILDICRQALDAGQPPEADSRLRRIIEKLQRPALSLLDKRIIGILDMIGTPKAKALRATLTPAFVLPDWTDLRTRMGVESMDEWMVLSSRIEPLLTLLRDPHYAPALQESMAADQATPALKQLRDMLDGHNATDTQLKTALQAFRAVHTAPKLDPDSANAISQMRNRLKMLLTVRQEAVLVSLHVLD